MRFGIVAELRWENSGLRDEFCGNQLPTGFSLLLSLSAHSSLFSLSVYQFTCRLTAKILMKCNGLFLQMDYSTKNFRQPIFHCSVRLCAFRLIQETSQIGPSTIMDIWKLFGFVWWWFLCWIIPYTYHSFIWFFMRKLHISSFLMPYDAIYEAPLAEWQY